MPPSEQPPADDAFLRAFWNEASTGNVRPLAHYLETHPDADPQLIRDEYAAVSASNAEDPERPRIGRYIVLGPLAVGGMGRLLRGWDPRLQKSVALKTLLPGAGRDPRARERLAREARIGGGLTGVDGVCPVLDIVEHEGSPVLVMPELEGVTLASVLARAKGVDPAERARSTWQALAHIGLGGTTEPTASARASRPTSGRKDDVRSVLHLLEALATTLAAMHERGLVHRDLKPENVLVRTDGEPVVLDFGLALDLQGDAPRLSLPGETVGTPAYMAPEQIQGDADEIGPRADVYALGAIAYELLTGRPPHGEGTANELLMRSTRGHVRPIRRLQPAIPRDLETLVLRTLERDPNSRLESARRFAANLRAIRTLRPIDLTRSSALTRIRSRVRRHPWFACSLATIAVLGTWLGWHLWRSSERERISSLYARAFDPSADEEERAEALRQIDDPALTELVEQLDPRLAEVVRQCTEALRAPSKQDHVVWPRGTLSGPDPRFLLRGPNEDGEPVHYAATLSSATGDETALRDLGPVADRAGLHRFALPLGVKLAPGDYAWRVGLDPKHYDPIEIGLLPPVSSRFTIGPPTATASSAPRGVDLEQLPLAARVALRATSALEAGRLADAVAALEALPRDHDERTALLWDACAQLAGGAEDLADLRAVWSADR